MIYSFASVDVESGTDICVDRTVLSKHASFIRSIVSEVQSASLQTIQLSSVSLKIKISILTMKQMDSPEIVENVEIFSMNVN